MAAVTQAKASAKIVCSNLMASSRCRARLPRGVSEAVVGPAARDEVAHVVAHADLVGPRLGHLVERALLGVDATEKGPLDEVAQAWPDENDEVALRIDVAGGAPGDFREIVHVH